MSFVAMKTVAVEAIDLYTAVNMTTRLHKHISKCTRATQNFICLRPAINTLCCKLRHRLIFFFCFSKRADNFNVSILQFGSVRCGQLTLLI